MNLLHSIRSSLKGNASQTDETLLAAVAQGDLAAFEQVHHRYQPKLMHFAKRITDSYEAAEEIANDTLLVVWRTADRFQGRSKPSSWIFGIAYRLSLKKRHSLVRRKDDTLLEESLVSDGKDTAEAVIRQKDLSSALQRLTPEQQAVVELTYYNGYLYTEIAEILGCPVGTVKTRMMTARRRLREMLSDDAHIFSENAVA